jgi:hypothetical protein
MNQKDIDKAVRERYERKEAEAAREAHQNRALREQAKELEGYTPTRFSPELSLFAFLLEALPCVHCAKPTMPNLERGPFPAAWHTMFSAQRDRAGIQPMAHWHDTNQPVCVECVKNSAGAFECSHCGKTRQLNESHQSFGCSPAEHLCVPCYERVPAKQWDGLVAELEEQHRYDFE